MLPTAEMLIVFVLVGKCARNCGNVKHVKHVKHSGDVQASAVSSVVWPKRPDLL